MTTENSPFCQEGADANGDADSSIVVPDTDKTMFPDVGSCISPEGAAHLEKHGIPVEFARQLGVRTVTAAIDLPDNLRWVSDKADVAGLLLPWRLPDGSVEYQYRPDTPLDVDGDLRKYIQPAGVRLVNVLGDPATCDQVLMVEGGKQAMSARSAAPETTLVIGISGCWGALEDGALLPGLADLVEGRAVTVIFDADMASKRGVWEAAAATKRALAVDADSVRFARLPGGGNTGLDDILGGRLPDKRSKLLARIVKQAQAALPKRPPAAPEGPDDRPWINVSGERCQQIDEILTAMQRWDAWRLFSHGDALAELCIDALKPAVRGTLKSLLAQTAVFYVPTDNGPAFRWPDGNVIESVEAAASRFSKLARLTNSPFVREDGSVCQEPGYDQSTATLLLPSEELDQIVVPDEPSVEQIQAAVTLLLEEWLGDMPLPEQADKANLLGLILTGFVRGMVPLVPMALINGLQAGVAKGLLANCLQMLWTGRATEPVTYPDDNNELRKSITATLMTGQEVIVYDEVGTLRGAALSQALTATVWRDRQLGYSRMVAVPNTAIWMALGNQVLVEGDMRRRVYTVALRPTDRDPESRDNNTYRHPDLLGWTRENRAQLLQAALTIIRGWFAAGQPEAPDIVRFGSFERWERLIGGILHFAGVRGFLGNLDAWRLEADFDTAYWAAHLGELWVHFGEEPFTVSEVVAALRDDDIREAPPRLTEVGGRGYPRELGQAYSRVRDRWFREFRIVRAGRPGDGGAHGSVNRWRVERLDPEIPAPQTPAAERREGSEGSEGSSTALSTVNLVASSASGLAKDVPVTSPALEGLVLPPNPSNPSTCWSSPDGMALNDPVRAAARLARSKALAEAMTARGLRLDLGPLEAAVATLAERQQRLRSSLIVYYGFPALKGDGSPASSPWITAAGRRRLDALTDGTAWPRCDGRAGVTLEALEQAVSDLPATGLGRLASTLLELQPEQFVASLLPNSHDGRVHPVYASDTVTGRWTSSQPNVLGAGRRTPALLAQRGFILAEPGEVFIGVDLDGLDARVVAGLSGDEGYADLMRPGVDVHAEVSRMVFGTPTRRTEAKRITHGIPYGRQAASIADEVGLPLSAVEAMVDNFRRAYPGIDRWRNHVIDQSRKGPVPTGTGRYVNVKPASAWTKGPGRVAQAAAHDIASEGLLRIIQAGYGDRISLFLHDEVILSVPAEDADTIVRDVAVLMSFLWQSPSGLAVPITASPHIKHGHRWSDLYDATTALVPVTT